MGRTLAQCSLIIDKQQTSNSSLLNTDIAGCDHGQYGKYQTVKFVDDVPGVGVWHQESKGEEAS